MEQMTARMFWRKSILFNHQKKLEIVSVRGEAAHFAPPHQSRALRGEGRIPFELFLEYTANLYFQRNRKKLPRRFAPRHGIFPL